MKNGGLLLFSFSVFYFSLVFKIQKISDSSWRTFSITWRRFKQSEYLRSTSQIPENLRSLSYKRKSKIWKIWQAYCTLDYYMSLTYSTGWHHNLKHHSKKKNNPQAMFFCSAKKRFSILSSMRLVQTTTNISAYSHISFTMSSEPTYPDSESSARTRIERF